MQALFQGVLGLPWSLCVFFQVCLCLCKSPSEFLVLQHCHAVCPWPHVSVHLICSYQAVCAHGLEETFFFAPWLTLQTPQKEHYSVTN